MVLGRIEAVHSNGVNANSTHESSVNLALVLVGQNIRHIDICVDDTCVPGSVVDDEYLAKASIPLTKNWLPSSLKNFVPSIETDEEALVAPEAGLPLYRSAAKSPSAPILEGILSTASNVTLQKSDSWRLPCNKGLTHRNGGRSWTGHGR